MNLDTIDVGITPPTEENPHDAVHLILNGECVTGTFDPLSLLVSSYYRICSIDLMTCSCGSSGCAGVFDGTEVKKRKHTVEWRDVDCGLPKRFYRFDREEYEKVVEKSVTLVKEIVSNRVPFDLTFENEHLYDPIIPIYTLDGLNVVLRKIKEKHSHGQTGSCLVSF